jgi:aminopeptidase
MADPRVETVAKILVDYSVEVQSKHLVRITGAPEGAPLILAVYRKVLERGAHPLLQIEPQEAEELLYAYASDVQLDYLPPFMKDIVEQIDANIRIWTAVNTKQLTSADPGKQSRRAASRRPIFDRFLERMARKELQHTTTLYPTQAFAQDAEMSLREYEDFVYKGCLIHKSDPVEAWKRISKKQQRVADWLNKAKEIHVVGTDTDLKLNVAGRTWINCDGRGNFPDGEIFTGPIENSVDGYIRYTYPACDYGREVEDVSFGTNPGIQRFTKNGLFDEKIGGTIHLALGAGYPESGSKNKSAIHWDMVCDLRKGGEVNVDETLFLKDGKILI